MKIENLLREGIEDEYKLQRLQNIILNIMVYIDGLCQENEIDYYIIGGSALGAIRHGGFIPWDDDLDIAMTRDNYNKFISICRSSKFDSKTFFFQQERRDWTGYFSKVRLLGTHFEESVHDESVPYEKQGIFVDIFPLDNVPNRKIQQYWWYFCGKMLVAYEQTTHNGYNPKGLTKRLVMLASRYLKYEKIRHYFEKEVEKYNAKDTLYIGGHSLVSRFNNTFTRKDLWGKAARVPFETVTLMAPEDIKGFLSFYFGDYMKLPPIESRRGHHLQRVDYGTIESDYSL